jgi:hypothetical protein
MIRKERLISTILAIMLMLSMVLDTVSCIPMHLHTHDAADTNTESSTTNIYVEAQTEGWTPEQRGLLKYFETHETDSGKYRVKNGRLVVKEEYYFFTDSNGEKHVIGVDNEDFVPSIIFEGGLVYKNNAITPVTPCTGAHS